MSDGESRAAPRPRATTERILARLRLRNRDKGVTCTASKEGETPSFRTRFIGLASASNHSSHRVGLLPSQTPNPQRHVARHGFPERVTLQRVADWWRASLVTLRDQLAA